MLCDKRGSPPAPDAHGEVAGVSSAARHRLEARQRGKEVAPSAHNEVERGSSSASMSSVVLGTLRFASSATVFFAISCCTKTRSSACDSFASSLFMEANSCLTEETNSSLCSFMRALISATVAVMTSQAIAQQRRINARGSGGRQRVSLPRH